jgi:hypothetical protein
MTRDLGSLMLKNICNKKGPTLKSPYPFNIIKKIGSVALNLPRLPEFNY